MASSKPDPDDELDPTLPPAVEPEPDDASEDDELEQDAEAWEVEQLY